MSQSSTTREGTLSSFGPLAVSLYRGANPRFRGLLRKLVLRAEGGPVYSWTIRRIYKEFHGVDVGLYTIGPCDVPPGNLDPGTTVGRYSSVYYTVRVINTPDPAKTMSSHRLFAPGAMGGGSAMGAGTEATRETLSIGHDVWMGHNVIVLPGAKSIGDGAIVGAGSVVHSSVPPYAVVTGNPARVVRYRFSEKIIQELMESKWWLKSIDELSGQIEQFQKPLDGSPLPK